LAESVPGSVSRIAGEKPGQSKPLSLDSRSGRYRSALNLPDRATASRILVEIPIVHQGVAGYASQKGPHRSAPERMGIVAGLTNLEFVLRSLSRLRNARNTGISQIFALSSEEKQQLQTVWRRERDSNPRSPFGLSGFQDRLFQPLTHPSA
jgi:hypothetical protein